MQTLTKAQATAAFEAWERDYRANPDSSFFTPEEAARMEVAPLSEQRAIHFMALLRQDGAAVLTTAADTTLHGVNVQVTLRVDPAAFQLALRAAAPEVQIWRTPDAVWSFTQVDFELVVNRTLYEAQQRLQEGLELAACRLLEAQIVAMRGNQSTAGGAA